jgi:hypothetical protein
VEEEEIAEHAVAEAQSGRRRKSEPQEVARPQAAFEAQSAERIMIPPTMPPAEGSTAPVQLLAIVETI